MVYVGSSWVELDYWTSPTGYGDYDARLRVLAYSTQDVAANTSRVYFKLQKRVTGGSAYNYNDLDFSITGTGGKNDGHSATQTWTFGSVSSTSWTDVGGDTSDMYWSGVKHNDNGSLTLTAHASGDRVLSGTFSTNISIELPTIPRASVPTASPNPLTIGSSGATLTVNTNRKSSSFTHTIKVQCGSWSWTSSARAVGASVNVTVPYSVIAQFSATSKTATATVTCTTFNGTTQIASAKTCSVTFQVNASVDHPNIGTATLSEGNARVASIVATADTFVQGISTLEVSAPITVSGSYTQLDKVTVSNGSDNKTYTLSGTSGTLNYSCANNRTTWLTITAYDKRGTTAVSKPAWTLLPYAPLTLTASVGRVSATGSTATGQISGVAYGGDYGQSTNSLTVTYKWKLHDAVSWTTGSQTYTLPISGSGQTNYSHAITFDESFDYQYQYDIEFTVNDLFSTAVYTCQLMQGLPIISWDETEVDVFGDLHIHDRENPYVYQDVMAGFDAILAHYGQKNFFVPFGTVTNSGITFTEYSDGSYKVAGTATANVWGGYGETRLKAGEYILSGSNSTVNLMLRDSSGNYVGESIGGNEFKFTLTSNAAYRCYITVLNGTTVDTTVYPMIRDARLASDAYVPPAETRYWNYKTFSNTSAGVTSGSVRWITIGKICFANFYDVVLTSVSRPHNTVLCTGLPPANTAILFLIQSWGTNYSGMRMRIDTDGTVYFHYTGASTAQQHYGTVFYIIK